MYKRQVVKGARHRKNAELFLEFIVSDDTQRFAEEYLCRRTIREDLELEAREPERKLVRFDLEPVSYTHLNYGGAEPFLFQQSGQSDRRKGNLSQQPLYYRN